MYYNESRVYRLDPYHTPEGRETPWLTVADMEWVAGMGGAGGALEGNGRAMRFSSAETYCSDAYGNLYITDDSNHVIWKIDPDLNGTIVAGIAGKSGYMDGSPKEALLNRPYGVAVTNDGRIYVLEAGIFLVRLVAIQ